MQLAIWIITSLPLDRILLVCPHNITVSNAWRTLCKADTHLSLPNSSSSRIHARPKSGDHASNIHLRHTPASRLNDCTYSNDR